MVAGIPLNTVVAGISLTTVDAGIPLNYVVTCITRNIVGAGIPMMLWWQVFL